MSSVHKVIWSSNELQEKIKLDMHVLTEKNRLNKTLDVW